LRGCGDSGVGSDDVGVAERAGPLIDAGSDLFQFPSVVVMVDVVVSA
jgi:hypothetical protein